MNSIRKYLFTDAFLWTRIFVFLYNWLGFLFHPDPLMPTSGEITSQARYYYLIAAVQHGNFESIIPILQGHVKPSF